MFGVWWGREQENVLEASRMLYQPRLCWVIRTSYFYCDSVRYRCRED